MSRRLEGAAFLLLACVLCCRQLYGQSAENLSDRLSWLRENRGAGDYGEVLLQAVAASLDAEEALRLLEEFTSFVEDPKQKAECLERRIQLLRLLGRGEEVLPLLESLSENPGGSLERAVLLFEQGRLEESEEALKPLLAQGAADSELEAKARYLLAQIRIAAGGLPEADALLQTLLKDHPEASIAPAALLARFETLRGEGGLAQAALEELGKRFPGSPEYALALRQVSGAEQASSYRYVPSPGRLLAAAKPPSAPEAPAQGSAFVQVGSFRDPENARYLASDLKNRGFAARIVEKTVSASRYFRVVIGADGGAEEAQSLLLLLKNAGFEGVLLLQD